eukprot:g69825.t1
MVLRQVATVLRGECSNVSQTLCVEALAWRPLYTLRLFIYQLAPRMASAAAATPESQAPTYFFCSIMSQFTLYSSIINFNFTFGWRK